MNGCFSHHRQVASRLQRRSASRPFCCTLSSTTTTTSQTPSSTF